jgi:hypothetical protein
MDFFNTEKRQEKKKEKQNQLFVTPIITVFPEEKKMHQSSCLLIQFFTKSIYFAFNNAP